MTSPQHSIRSRTVDRAFTLVEILIVVIILGILASIVIPQFSNASDSAKQAAFKADLRHLIQAAQLYFANNNALPMQAAGAEIPPEIVAALPTGGRFPLRTPIGGYWHVGSFSDVNRWGVGVWWPGDEPQVLTEAKRIDNDLDDGDPATGAFQSRENARYYWMIN